MGTTATVVSDLAEILKGSYEVEAEVFMYHISQGRISP